MIVIIIAEIADNAANVPPVAREIAAINKIHNLGRVLHTPRPYFIWQNTSGCKPNS